MTRRRPRLAVLSLCAATLLAVASGCGVTQAAPGPGTAAVVGERTVTTDEVNSTATSLCTVISGAAGQQPRSMGALRAVAHRGLVLDAMAVQIAAEHDVDVAAALQQFGAELPAAYPDAPEEDLERVLPAFLGEPHLGLVLEQVAGLELGGDAEEQEVWDRGYQIAIAWAQEHEVRSSPAFEEVEFGEDGLRWTRAELSVPVSEWARTALEPTSAQAEATLLEDLPASQRCMPAA